MEKRRCPCCQSEIGVTEDGSQVDLSSVLYLMADEAGTIAVDDETGDTQHFRKATPEEQVNADKVLYDLHPCYAAKKYLAKIPDYIDRETGWVPDGPKSDHYHTEMYTDYNDEISDEEVAKILSTDSLRERFSEKIRECYSDEEGRIISDLVSGILEAIPELNCCENAVWDWVYSHCEVEYPYKHYLSQEVFVNISVNTGDWNADFTLNQIYPAFDTRIEDPVDSGASLVWLAKQQGYSKRVFQTAMREGEYGSSKLLRSMRRELVNVASHMNTLTFFVKVTIEEAIQIQELLNYRAKIFSEPPYEPKKIPYCGYIVINKNTRCGLVDTWNGGGSVLELDLEKDVKLPVKYIFDAMPDGCADSDAYSVSEIYGARRLLWESGGVDVIHYPAKAAAS